MPLRHRTVPSKRMLNDLQMWSDMSAASIALAKALILRRFCREDRSFQLVFEGSFECELANDQNLFERLEDAIKRVSVHSACICRISRGSYAVNLWCSNQCVPIKPFVIIIDARASTWLWMTLVYFFSRFSRDPRYSPFQFPTQNGNGVGPCKMGLGPAFVENGWELHFVRFQCLCGWKTFENRKSFFSKGSCPSESNMLKPTLIL